MFLAASVGGRAREGAGRGRAGRQEGGSVVDAVRDEQLGGGEHAAGGAEVRVGQLRAGGDAASFLWA